MSSDDEPDDPYSYDYDDDYDEPDNDYDYVVLQGHELLLDQYRPETTAAEDSSVVDVLKVADMTIKLVDALKLRLNSAEMYR